MSGADRTAKDKMSVPFKNKLSLSFRSFPSPNSGIDFRASGTPVKNPWVGDRMRPISNAGLKTQSPRQWTEQGKSACVGGCCWLSVHPYLSGCLLGISCISVLSPAGLSGLIYNTFDKSPQAEKGSRKRDSVSKSFELPGRPLTRVSTCTGALAAPPSAISATFKLVRFYFLHIPDMLV